MEIVCKRCEQLERPDHFCDSCKGFGSIETDLTENEIKVINALKVCRFLPGSFDKRFVRNLSHDLSEKQRYWLHKLGYKYRAQIGNDGLTKYCQEWLANHPHDLPNQSK